MTLFDPGRMPICTGCEYILEYRHADGSSTCDCILNGYVTNGVGCDMEACDCKRDWMAWAMAKDFIGQVAGLIAAKHDVEDRRLCAVSFADAAANYEYDTVTGRCKAPKPEWSEKTWMRLCGVRP